MVSCHNHPVDNGRAEGREGHNDASKSYFLAKLEGSGSIVCQRGG